ncbi:probable amino acid permease 7 [Tripterygium wilfordii]|uniref:probable amino acid permease 7 n=1 Tax=Tripterygium wilfordii TaxID=458696 RepID=UPI0018F81A88|nr:probable amino acid permease 7 [Tripterygium wilfordii]
MVEHQVPLLGSFSSSDHGEALKRTGTMWTAVAHIITAVIGSGVLSLAWSVAQLGWIAGPLSLIFFAGITIVSSFLLCDCYRHPDPEYGPNRNPSYLQAVKFFLGEKSQKLCRIFAYESFYGAGVAYTITSAISMRAIQKANCYHIEGHEAKCEYGDNFYMLLFGAVQIVMSQIPDFHSLIWLSVLAAIMSFSYSFIGFGLGFAQVIETGEIKGSISGVPAANLGDKFQALGDIAFAYPFTLLVLEIQDTLRSPPSENKTMKKAAMTATSLATFFYFCCGCFGYAAFGNNTPGNILTGFGFYEPYWLIGFANACIVLHLIGGYQIYSQPVFSLFERWLEEKYPSSGYMNTSYKFKLPLLPPFRINLCRLWYRTLYVISTTTVAMMFPYFNQVLGVLGSLNFWPMSIYFPVEMYLVQKKISPWTTKWIILNIFSLLGLIVSIAGLVGSVQGIIGAKFG